MIVRFGNTAPVFIKTHDPRCIPECPARHQAIVGWETTTDEATGDIIQTPVYELVHDGTAERVVVDIGDDAYRVTESDVAVHPDTHDLADWLDRAFESITGKNGAWPAVSDQPPAWVESDWPDLERRLAAWFDCPIGEPIPEMES